MRSVELFTGAGGLALAIEKAGFHHDTVVERDKDCCATLRENQARGFDLLDGWRLFPGDVRHFDYSGIAPGVDLLAGGPPCQPFSIGGKHKAHKDRRDMFPEVVRAVRELRPRAILVENVKGSRGRLLLIISTTSSCNSAIPRSSVGKVRTGPNTGEG